MKEQVIKDKTELAKLLMVCEALKLVKISVPNVLGAEKDIFKLIYYGHTTPRQIADEFANKGAM